MTKVEGDDGKVRWWDQRQSAAKQCVGQWDATGGYPACDDSHDLTDSLAPFTTEPHRQQTSERPEWSA